MHPRWIVVITALALMAARPAHAYCLSGNMGNTKCSAFPKTTISYRVSSNLTDAGLLQREQRGKWAYYTLVPAALAAIATAITPTG